VAGVLALFLGAGGARAEAPSRLPAEETQAFRVVFSSSSVCNNPSEFVEQLQRRTGHLRPANAVEPALTFFVSLNSTQAGVQGHLRVQNPDGTGSSREVPGVDCHEVLSAMALIGALVVDPFAVTTEELPPPPPPPRPEPESPKVVAPPTRAGWSFEVGHRLNLNAGVLPGFGWGQSLFVEAGLPVTELFQPSARLSGHHAQNVEVDALGTGEFTWTAARLALCPVVWAPEPSVSVRPCVFVDAGQFQAEGIAVPAEKLSSLFWAAAGPELEFEVRLVGPLTLGAEIGWMFPLVRHDWFYFLPGQVHVHQISSGFAAGLGLGLRFF
jgi:hypothetical protein